MLILSMVLKTSAKHTRRAASPQPPVGPTVVVLSSKSHKVEESAVNEVRLPYSVSARWGIYQGIYGGVTTYDQIQSASLSVQCQ